MWLLLALALSARGYEIAVTIDDLPWVGPVPPGGKEAATVRLLEQLDRAEVHVTGFVNCGKPDQELLGRWMQGGHTLGNHTTSHFDIDKVPVDKWLADARSCHRDLTEVLGSPPTLFRYPYLRNGASAETRDTAHAALTGEFGQTIGRVTVDNHDWKLGELYGAALNAGDTARAEALTTYYPQHIVAAVAHYRDVAERKLGRDVKHVLLLHANALTADHVGEVLETLRAGGAEFIGLEEALKDPVYALPDGYVGRGGQSWLYHVHTEVEVDRWDDAAWYDLEQRFGDR